MTQLTFLALQLHTLDCLIKHFTKLWSVAELLPKLSAALGLAGTENVLLITESLSSEDGSQLLGGNTARAARGCADCKEAKTYRGFA